jgi:hypothetical protein
MTQTIFNYTQYQVSNGQITGSLMYSGEPGSANANVPGDIASVAGAYNGNTTYIATTSGGTPTPTARPAMGITLDKTTIIANGTDTATFSGVPSGASVVIDGGAAETITDGTLELSTATAGTYTFAFTNFPMLPMNFEIIAT